MYSQRANPGDVLLTFVNQLNYFYQCTEVRFASFISGGFTTMAVMNPPEKNLEKT